MTGDQKLAMQAVTRERTLLEMEHHQLDARQAARRRYLREMMIRLKLKIWRLKG